MSGARPARPLPPSVALLGPALAAAAVYLVSFRWSPRWLFPCLLAAPLLPYFVSAVRRGWDARAMVASLAWAVAVSLAATGVSMHRPAQAEVVILNARPYAEETLQWIRTGEGAEQSPTRFLPRQALELAVFSVLALASGGTLALVLGAVLLNTMSFYVAALWRLSSQAPATLVFGWPPWAVVRVAAYVALGTALARPLLARLPAVESRGNRPPPFARWLLFAGLAGVVLDALLKAWLAPAWRRVIIWAAGGLP